MSDTEALDDERMMQMAVHELTTLLCQIRDVASYSHLNSGGTLAGTEASLLRSIAFRGLRYLDNLRVIRRQGAPAEIRRHEAPDIVRTIQGIADDFQRDVADHDLVLDVSILGHGSDLPYQLDSRVLYLALGNVLDNAIRYSKPKTSVRLVAQLPPDGSIKLEVHNLSVAPAPTDGLFEIGRRGEMGKQYRVGLGIGLWVANEVVRWHNGTLHIRSGTDGLTVVTISVPHSVARDDM